MDLPPELIDEIISHIPPHDVKSLRNCSLVAKTWVFPSQRRIFEIVKIDKRVHLKSWLGSISPENIEVLQHVRTLHYNYQVAKENLNLPNGSDIIRRYLPSFCKLGRLTLVLGHFTSPTQIGAFSAFQQTLSYLCLWSCSVTISTLATFVNCFPNLAHLDLTSLSSKPDDQPAPSFSRPLRKLSIAEFITGDSLDLLDQLMELRPRSDEVSVNVGLSSSPSVTQRIVDGMGASIKRMNLKSNLLGG